MKKISKRKIIIIMIAAFAVILIAVLMLFGKETDNKIKDEVILKEPEFTALLNDLRAHSSYDIDLHYEEEQFGGCAAPYIHPGLQITVRDALSPEQQLYDHIRENKEDIAEKLREKYPVDEIRLYYFPYCWFTFDLTDSAWRNEITFQYNYNNDKKQPISGQFRGIVSMTAGGDGFADISELKCFPDVTDIILPYYSYADKEYPPVNEDTEIKSIKSASVAFDNKNAFEFLRYFTNMDELDITGNSDVPKIKIGGELPQVKKLRFIDCDNFDLGDLEYFPNLEQLDIVYTDLQYDAQKKYSFPQVKTVTLQSGSCEGGRVYEVYFDVDILGYFPRLEKFLVYGTGTQPVAGEENNYRDTRKIKEHLPEGCTYERIDHFPVNNDEEDGEKE